jgi:hypothetical protein
MADDGMKARSIGTSVQLNLTADSTQFDSGIIITDLLLLSSVGWILHLSVKSH